MTKFKVGDIVEAFGVRGVVTKVLSNGGHPVLVDFERLPGEAEEEFTPDGRLFYWHKEPSLKLIERQKKKVKKTIETWLNIYPDGYNSHYHTQEECDNAAMTSRIACVKLSGEYEVEE